MQEARREAGPHPNAAAQVGIAAAQRAVALAQERLQRRQAALIRAEQQQRAVASAPVSVHLDDAEGAAVRASRHVAAAPAPAPVTAPAPPAPPHTEGAATTIAAPPAAPANTTLNTDDGPITLDDVLKKIARENIMVDGKPWLNAQMQANLSNPPLFYNHLQEAASRWGFLLVPLSLPFIAFLFLFKKRITLYDHTVFALNSLSFASLLFALMLAAAPVEWLHWAPGLAIGVGLPVHTFFHVGGAYKLKLWSAFWRTWFLLIFATIVLICFLLTVLFIGLAG